MPAVTVSALALSVVSCASEKPVRQPESGDLCGIADDRAARKSLIDLIGSRDLKTVNDGDVTEAAKEMRAELTHPIEAGEESGRDVCYVYPRSREDGDLLNFSFAWRYAFSLDGAPEPSGPGYTFYNLHGATAESSPESARIYVPCSPPKNSASSRERFLIAHSQNYLPRNRKAKVSPLDNQLIALHAVARKMTREIGCTNNPLRGKPNLTRYDTLDEAVRAGA